MKRVDCQSLESEPWWLSARPIAVMVSTSLALGLAIGFVVSSTQNRLYVPAARQSMGRVIHTTAPAIRAPSWPRGPAPTTTPLLWDSQQEIVQPVVDAYPSIAEVCLPLNVVACEQGIQFAACYVLVPV